MSERPQNKNLRPIYPKLSEGERATKAMRFTLPADLATRLESMSKGKRDELMRRALELSDSDK